MLRCSLRGFILTTNFPGLPLQTLHPIPDFSKRQLQIHLLSSYLYIFKLYKLQLKFSLMEIKLWMHVCFMFVGPSGVKLPSSSNIDTGSFMKDLPLLVDTDDSSDEYNTDLPTTYGMDDKPFHPSTFKKATGWSGLYNAFKQGNSRATKVYKCPDLFSSGGATNTPSYQLVSTAMDCRLEQGVETTAELRLKIMSSMELDTLHNAIHSSLPTPPEGSVDLSNLDEPTVQASPLEGMTTMEMLSSCFDSMFLQLRSGNINVELLLSVSIFFKLSFG